MVVVVEMVMVVVGMVVVEGSGSGGSAWGNVLGHHLLRGTGGQLVTKKKSIQRKKWPNGKVMYCR